MNFLNKIKKQITPDCYIKNGIKKCKMAKCIKCDKYSVDKYSDDVYCEKCKTKIQKILYKRHNPEISEKEIYRSAIRRRNSDYF